MMGWLREMALRLPLACLLMAGSTSAQIMNIDRSLQQDSAHPKYRFSLGASLSTDKNKSNLLDFSVQSEYDRYLKKQHVLLFMLKGDATFNDRATLQNDGYLHIRYRDNDSRKWSPEYFAQYQWNGAWGMEYRTLGGVNLRYKWFDKHNFDLYTGLGVFHEWEKWNWSGVKDQPIPPGNPKVLRQNWRLNHYWKISGKISPMVDVAGVAFFQFPLDGKSFQPRWFVDTRVFIKTGKHLSFVVHWDHIIDHQPPVPIDAFFYSFNTGIQINY